jgi:hypothetical protein
MFVLSPYAHTSLFCYVLRGCKFANDISQHRLPAGFLSRSASGYPDRDLQSGREEKHLSSCFQSVLAAAIAAVTENRTVAMVQPQLIALVLATMQAIGPTLERGQPFGVS